MRTISRRHSVVLAMLIALGIFDVTENAAGDVWGADVAVLGDILAQAYIMVSKLKDQIDALGTQIDLMHTMLETVDPRSFDDISNLLTQSEISYGALVGGVGAIDYTVEAVNREFQSAFPADLSTAKASSFD